MGLSWAHILIVLVVFILLFGRGKISDLMGDVAKGIKSFKHGLAEDDDESDKQTKTVEDEPPTLEHQPAPPMPEPKPAKKTASRSAASSAKKPATRTSSRKTSTASKSTARKTTSGSRRKSG